MFEPGTKAMPEQFVARNDLIAALADAVIVVEARKKSATLNLVEKAQALGKRVYALPGRVTDRLSDGCNELIKNGVTPFFEVEQLCIELGMERRAVA